MTDLSQSSEPGALQPVVRSHLPALASSQPPSPAPERERDGIELRVLLGILLERKWTILAVVWSVLLAAFIQVFTATPMYRSSAVVQIDLDQQKVLPYEDEGRPSFFSPKASEEYLLTQAVNMQSRSLAKRVLERLEPKQLEILAERPRKGFFLDRISWLIGLFSGSPAKPAGAVGTDVILNNLEVEALHNTRLLEVNYFAPEPKLAQDVVQLLIDEHIEQNFETKFSASSRATEFLQRQLSEIRQRVEESEALLLEYARERGIINVGNKEIANAEKLMDLTEELTRIENDFIAKTASFEAVRGATVDSFPPQLENNQIQELMRRISEAEKRLAGLLTTYGPAWPEVQEVRQEVAELETQLRSQRLEAIQKARTDFAIARDRYQRLQAAVGGQQELVDKLNTDAIQYAILKRDVDTNKQLYEGLLQRLKEAAVASGLRSSNLAVADAPSLPVNAARPDKIQAMLLALVLGLVAGAGLAFALEAIDNTISSSDELTEQLGLPAMGMIPWLALDEGSRRRRWWVRRAEQETGPLLLQDVPEKQRYQLEEAYRSLRTSIQLSHSGKPPQTILVSSALVGEGKSSTAANVAAVLARTGGRTVLVDLDLRRASLSREFAPSVQQGMSTYLTGNSDLTSQIWETDIPKMLFVPAGPVAPNPTELLGSEQLRQGLQLLSEHFDYVVIDSPPALQMSDAVVLSPFVDGVLLVVRANSTPREAIRKTVDRLVGVGGHLLGGVINAASMSSWSYGYYGYGEYYDRDSERRAESTGESA